MKNKCGISIIALMIVFTPITNLVHHTIPAYLFGKSAWVTIAFIILAIVYVVNFIFLLLHFVGFYY